MDCAEVRPALIELVFGELDSVEEMRVNQHLLACAECRREEEGLLELSAAARGRAIEPRARLRESLAAALARPGAARVSFPLGRPVPAYVAIAAALLAALAVALLPIRRPLFALPERGAARAAGIVPAGREAPFMVADSWDTRVASGIQAVESHERR